MLLSRLSQLAALSHEEICQQEHNCLWHIQQLTFVALLSALCMRSRVLQEGLVYWQSQSDDSHYDRLSQAQVLMYIRTVP